MSICNTISLIVVPVGAVFSAVAPLINGMISISKPQDIKSIKREILTDDDKKKLYEKYKTVIENELYYFISLSETFCHAKSQGFQPKYRYSHFSEVEHLVELEQENHSVFMKLTENFEFKWNEKEIKWNDFIYDVNTVMADHVDSGRKAGDQEIKISYVINNYKCTNKSNKRTLFLKNFITKESVIFPDSLSLFKAPRKEKDKTTLDSEVNTFAAENTVLTNKNESEKSLVETATHNQEEKTRKETEQAAKKTQLINEISTLAAEIQTKTQEKSTKEEEIKKLDEEIENSRI